MKKLVVVSAAVATVAAAGVLFTRRRMTTAQPRDERSRWRVVTVQRSEADVVGAMSPLTALGSGIETRLSTAPGDRGTELAARILPGSDLEPDELRIALRQTKQLAEAGEIAVVNPAPHGHRPSTPQGLLLDRVAKAAEGKGIL